MVRIRTRTKPRDGRHGPKGTLGEITLTANSPPHKKKSNPATNDKPGPPKKMFTYFDLLLDSVLTMNLPTFLVIYVTRISLLLNRAELHILVAYSYCKLYIFFCETNLMLTL